MRSTGKNCSTCHQPIASLSCGLCENALCKDCVQALESDAFSYLKTVPKNLSHLAYCDPCFATQVAPALESYAETMGRAKNVFVFYISQRKAIPLIKKSKEKLRIENCPDRDETLLRMAFFAAEKSFNALIDVDLVSEKIRNGSYQTSKWSGTGFPANIDSEKLERQYARDQIYR